MKTYLLILLYVIIQVYRLQASKMLLFTLLELVFKISSFAAEPFSNFNYNISVQRDCDTDKIKGEIDISTPVTANLSKCLTSKKIQTSEPDAIEDEECHCKKDTTFVAVNGTCIGNNVLRKKYGKYQVPLIATIHFL